VPIFYSIFNFQDFIPWMKSLDSFTSPILGLKGTFQFWQSQSPSGESASDLSVEASAGASNTRVGKHKTTATLTPQKKAKKATCKSTSGIKINEPAPKASFVPTPPSGSQKKIQICRSNRYARL
jgi:hypothetical protein